MNCGKFVISLDFELFWGFRGEETLDSYGKNISGVHQLIPKLLEVFEKYKVCVTFSTVGFLFFETKQELLQNIPDKIPQYTNGRYSPYSEMMETVGSNYQIDPYHFAPKLINKIMQYPGQEIGSHTFSHYYCLEPGQNSEDFRADLIAAISIAKKRGINITSLVFPKNQVNKDYLSICEELGIICYRGTGDAWHSVPRPDEEINPFHRVIRLIDNYINITGYNCFTDEYMQKSRPINIPGSRFLRPYSKKMKLLENIRLRRIKSEMTYAAQNQLTYHLWWHPHNFGINQSENLAFLNKVLLHYIKLRNQYNFQNYTMTELTKKLINA